jgi:hypothetical protein
VAAAEATHMTRDDLVNEALTRLGALPAGQSADAEDFDYVNDRVEGVLDDLAQRDVFAATVSDIPDAAFLHLAAVLANRCKGYFGVVGQESVGMTTDAEVAEQKLRLLVRRTTQNRPVKAVYF